MRPDLRLRQFGQTRVLCNASVLDKVPPHKRGSGEGWVTAEYGMLPRSTPANAFLCSCLAIIGLAITAGTALYPNLLPAVNAARSLTVDNAHSSDLALAVMLVVAVIGMPIVLAYTSFIYWKFKGKVRLDGAGY